MKVNSICLMLFLFANQIAAQVDYFIDEIYDEVQVTEDIVYGVNMTFEAIYSAGLQRDTLKMDIYEPVGDLNEVRPLMIVLHDGFFLQKQINGRITGERRDSSVVNICTKFAKRGYTAVAIDYRKGWNPLAPSYTERSTSFVQAVYRAMQDGRTAVRFFRRDIAENGNQYQVDGNRIAVWGLGGGGFTALAMNSVEDYEEFIVDANFFIDTDGDQIPDLPIIVDSWHGDADGEMLTIVPAAAIIPESYLLTAGDTVNLANHSGYSSEISLSLNTGGAILTTDWLHTNPKPTITFQDINDPLVDYEINLIPFPTIDLIFPFKGAYYIGETQAGFGGYDLWEGMFLNEPLTDIAMQNSMLANHPYYQGVFPFAKAPNSFGYYEGIPIDWWDPNALAVFNFNGGDPLPWNETPSNAGSMSMHEQALLLNENMSATKARANIDTLIQYAAPRLCVALDLACEPVATEEIASAEEIGLSIAPNPSHGLVQIKTSHAVIRQVALYDLMGRLVESFDIHNSAFEFQKRDKPYGIYIIKLTTDKGMISQKLVFQ